MIHFHASLVQFVGFAIATALFMGCGEDTNTNTQSSGSGGEAGASQTWTGTPSGDALQISIQIAVQLESPPGSLAYVEVFHVPTDKQLDGVNVTLTPLGAAPITLSATGDMSYKENFPDAWVASYKVDIEHPLGSRKGIIVTPPSKFSIAVNPPPKADTPSTVTWSPFGDANFGALVSIGKYMTPAASPLMDTGSFEVPGTAFSGLSGDLSLKVLRQKRDIAPNGEVVASVIVGTSQTGIKLEP